jgi:hypothetical protein
MLQAWRLRVLFPMRALNILNVPNTSSRTVALGFTQSLTDMSTENVSR